MSRFRILAVPATMLAASAALATMLASNAALSRPFSDPRSARFDAVDSDPQFAATPADPACTETRLVSTGGPAPHNPHTLVVRWTGFSNFELAYRDKIILLDAFIDRGSNYPPLGFAAADVKRADAIVIGHGHFDHMSDAASIALRTGALVVGAPVTTEKLASQSVPQAQIRTVTGKGEEVLQFDGFTIEPILARHGQPDRHITEVMEGALNSLAPKLTPAQEAEERAIRARGTSDPRIIREGTIAYLITLDDGFRIIYRDSGGHVTEQEKAVMQRVGGVDLALVAVSADFIPALTAQQALEHMQTYHPDVYMPAHHDAAFAGHAPLWRATEPVFQALKDANPKLVAVSRNYREPVCFNTEFNLSHSGRN
jgi:L-ascorbate metabolism protein UlaG (beta-lactamase superfamily)